MSGIVEPDSRPQAARQPGRSLGLASLPNLRDVGGYVTRNDGIVRSGVLFRSTDLSKLEGSDAAAFAGLGIRTVYDLRTGGERAAQPDRLPPGTEYVVADVVRDSPDASPRQLMELFDDPRTATEVLGGGRAIALWAGKYREFVQLGSARAAYRRLFSDIADEARLPALVHCTTGKDRTGWAAAALLLLLGVPVDLVMRDYLLSGEYLAPTFQPVLDEFEARGGDPGVLRALADVRPEYLEAALDAVHASYGTIEGYFAGGLGVDAAAQLALRARFVERS